MSIFASSLSYLNGIVLFIATVIDKNCAPIFCDSDCWLMMACLVSVRECCKLNRRTALLDLTSYSNIKKLLSPSCAAHLLLLHSMSHCSCYPITLHITPILCCIEAVDAKEGWMEEVFGVKLVNCQLHRVTGITVVVKVKKVFGR